MKNFSLLLALLPSLAIAQPQPFITGGVDATMDDYKDYIVALDIGYGTTCGGTLLSGKWILTAKHCTPLWDDNHFDVDARVKVYQGLGFYDEDELVFDGQALKYHEWSWQENRDYREHVIDNIIYPLASDLLRVDDFNHSSKYIFHGSTHDTTHDTVLIELPVRIPHQESVKFTRPAVLEDSYTASSIEGFISDLSIELDTSFTFMGWGMDWETNQLPTSLQKAEVHVIQRPADMSCTILGMNQEGEMIQGDCSFDTHTPEYKSNSVRVNLDTSIDIRTAGSLPLTGTAPGDSGTGLYGEDNTIYGVVSRGTWFPSDGTYTSAFNATQWYSHWFTQVLNSLSTSSAFNQVETEADVYEPEYTVTVQNMSLDTQVIAPSLTDSEFFYIAENRCPELLEVFEHCEIEIRGNQDARLVYFGESYESELEINVETHVDLFFGVDENPDLATPCEFNDGCFEEPPFISPEPCLYGDEQDCFEEPEVPVIPDPCLYGEDCYVDPCDDGSCDIDSPDSPEKPDSGSKGGSTSLVMLAALALLARFRVRR